MLETSWLWFVISKEYVELTRPKIESRDPIFFTGTRSRSRVSGNDRLFPCGSEFGPNLEIPAGPAIQLRPGPGQGARCAGGVGSGLTPRPRINSPQSQFLTPKCCDLNTALASVCDICQSSRHVWRLSDVYQVEAQPDCGLGSEIGTGWKIGVTWSRKRSFKMAAVELGYLLTKSSFWPSLWHDMPISWHGRKKL